MDISETGYKFHMNDIAATLGFINLEDSDKILEKRKWIAEYYKKNLFYPVIVGGAYWLAGILVRDRDKVAKELSVAGIETNMAHLRNDIFSVFGGTRQNLPVMNGIESYYLYIPLHYQLTMKQVKYIVKILNQING